MWSRRRVVWTGVLAPMVLLLGVVAAWAIDTGASAGEVLRNVDLTGHGIGGLAADDLLEEIQELGDDFAQRRVRIEADNVAYQTTAGDLGLSVDTIKTTNAALAEGRSAVLPARPFGWVLSFVRHHEAQVHYSIDVEQARSTLRQLEGSAQVLPVEPTIESVNGGPFKPVEGELGSGINPQTLANDLVEVARNTAPDETLVVSARQGPVEPRLTMSIAAKAAEAANALTDKTITITAADQTVELGPTALRELATVVESKDGMSITWDNDATLNLLTEEFSDLTQEPKSASFTVEGNVPKVIPGHVGRTCCDTSHAIAVDEALQAGASAVTLRLKETKPELTTEAAEALGIVQEIGSPTAFGPTTHHACCQGRVTNIHLMADIVRGAVIKPGETFSVNDYVGRRTVEKGFVSAGVIYDGEFTDDVGGGVSQFATTLFNAALYAGLEIPTYQSHSIYIDRYPRGHEATINFPNVDLRIKNNTEYGVLIWPTYTDTSLTVHLYSTPSIDVSLGEATSTPVGVCKTWTTPRTRTFADGEVVHDSVHATYRPEEGVQC